MPVRTRTKKRPVAELAEHLGEDAGWVGGLLNDLGVPVDREGRYDPRKLTRLLDRLRSTAPQAQQVDAAARSMMGGTGESCRRYLISELAQHGIEVIHRAEHHNARFTVRLPSGKKLWFATYVALRPKSSHQGQVGFRAGPGESDDKPDWYVFVAGPFGKVYVRSRSEMRSRWQKRHKGPMGQMSVTFSIGQEADLLENRVEDILAGKQ